MKGADLAYFDGNEANGEPVLAALFRALERRDTLEERERRALEASRGEVKVFAPGTTLARAGAMIDASSLLLEGVVGRVVYGPDGQRQIVAMHVAGDFIDLHGFVLRVLDHDIVALSNVQATVFPHSALTKLTQQEPHLTRLLWLMTAIDAAVHREWIARLGLPAATRIAQLLCEIDTRLDVVGLATPDGFPLPLTQSDIADATALTPVHVNRTLRKLRETGLATVRSGFVSVPDRDRLREFAGFDPTTLNLISTPR